MCQEKRRSSLFQPISGFPKYEDSTRTRDAMRCSPFDVDWIRLEEDADFFPAPSVPVKYLSFGIPERWIVVVFVRRWTTTTSILVRGFYPFCFGYFLCVLFCFHYFHVSLAKPVSSENTRNAAQARNINVPFECVALGNTVFRGRPFLFTRERGEFQFCGAKHRRD